VNVGDHEAELVAMTEHEQLLAQLSSLVQPLVAAGWREGEHSDEWDRDLGASVMITLTRLRDILDVEFFDAGWCQVYAYNVDYEPNEDEPSEPTLVLENPSALEAECGAMGWLG
jgi:hypothetical protein